MRGILDLGDNGKVERKATKTYPQRAGVVASITRKMLASIALVASFTWEHSHTPSIMTGSGDGTDQVNEPVFTSPSQPFTCFGQFVIMLEKVTSH